MENEIQAQHCRNCGSPLPPDARYCPSCSQRNHDGRLTLKEMTAEAVGTLFNLDNRIFRTLRALAIPGKLTVDYFEGKHVRYYHPLRLFLFTGLALISVMTVRYRQSESFTTMEKQVAEMEQSHHRNQFYLHLDSVKTNLKKELNNPAAIQAVDTFAARADFLDPSSEFSDSTSFNVQVFDKNHKGVKVSTRDFMELSPDSILTKYQIEGFWNRLFAARSMRMMKGTNEFLMSMFGNAIWMLLVMMPLLALVLKLLYIRRNFFFYEHLVFSLHVHAATFAMLFLLMAFTRHPPGWATGIVFTLIFLYPFLAQKRVYKQGYLKTFAKYFVLNLAYGFLGIASFILLAMLSFVLF